MEKGTPTNQPPAAGDDKKIKHFSMSLPKGGGAIRGLGEKFQANAVTGTGSFSVPLPATPGRSNFSPQLALAYNSGSGNSAFGLGWDIGLPSITRKTDKHLPTYNDAEEADTFILSGAEDLVPVLEQNQSVWARKKRQQLNIPSLGIQGQFEICSYRPRVEGLFARIERWRNLETAEVHWQATTKENVTSYYGLTAQARIAKPGEERVVFSWLLEKTRDAKNNVIAYEYKSENGDNVEPNMTDGPRLSRGSSFAQKYLKRVFYTPMVNAANRFHMQLVLDYGEHTSDTSEEQTPWTVRQDPFSEYKSGFEIRTWRLCRRVLMFHNFPADENAPDQWQLVKAMELGYLEQPTLTYLASVVQKGYKPSNQGYETKALPLLEFEYTAAEIDTTIRQVDEESRRNLPDGIDHKDYQWVDLKGEGLSGILSYQAGRLYYKENLGSARFGEAAPVLTLPQPVAASNEPVQVADVNSDGMQEIVVRCDTVKGYFSFAQGEWQDFTPFASNPTINLNDPSVKMIDLTGDGRPDILVTERDVLVWYPSLGGRGYDAPHTMPRIRQEEQGPAVVFADSSQSIFLADMSGDGLQDIVRIRNGEVCYWPNLGYGRFGAKVEMRNAPRFCQDSRAFNPRNIQLNDLDGSGTTDIFYFGNHKVEYWLNQAGNGFGPRQEIDFPLPFDSLTTISLVDLTAKGTLSLVWSTARPGMDRYQLSYMELMKTKPHLLCRVDNHLGQVTELAYAPSSRYYLADKQQGRPWVTKLPFPVQALAQVTTIDAISASRLVTRYTYHHGYYDPHEREFRGFGMVETLDTETFEHYTDDPKDYVAPVLTKTWFHTGAMVEAGKISCQYEKEYYTADPQAFTLPDTVIDAPDALDAVGLREAYRSLKGSALRQEIYQDGETHPYQVTEANFCVKTLQPIATGNRHAVFYTHPHESITFHYEQNPDDPRISHEFTLEVDAYGNTLQSCSLVYPRRPGAATSGEQAEPYATLAVNAFANCDGDFYLAGVLVESRRYELNGLLISAGQQALFTDVRTHASQALANWIPPEQAFTPANAQARVFHWMQHYYWDQNQPAALPLGQVMDRAQLHHSEAAVFTPQGVGQVFGSDVTAGMLDGAGYVLHDGFHWNPGLIQHYTTGGFFLPYKTEDPFGACVDIEYDTYVLLPVGVKDALANETKAKVDYRTLQPWQLTDPNGNVSEAVTDPLGMVMATSVYGSEAGVTKGDDPLFGEDGSSIWQKPRGESIEMVLASPETFLQQATTYFFYDLHAWVERQEPPQSVLLARETHVSELAEGESSRIFTTIAYTDGFGRELQTKIRVEPGRAWVKQADDSFLEEDVEERWLASGRTVYNNKAKPVKQYEPFYTACSQYEAEAFFASYGVTPVLHYDPLLRLVRTDTPKGFHSKVEFTPWEIRRFDENDTVLDSAYYHKSGLPPEELAALAKAAAHANTPKVSWLDTLGREYQVLEYLLPRDQITPENRAANELVTHTTFTITGKPATITDPRQLANATGKKTFEYTYDMLDQVVRTVNIDAGDDRVLVNALGNPVFSWDKRGHRIAVSYDPLQRPLTTVVTGLLDNTVERLIYGESQPNPEYHNLRGKLFRHYDQAGMTETPHYSFKGEALQVVKRIRQEYKAEANWYEGGDWASELAAEIFTTATQYDALGRVAWQQQPDESETTPEFHPSGKLNQVKVKLRGESSETEFVKSIRYNPKGQREKIVYGNDAETEYTYERETFRLTSLKTKRTSSHQELQDIAYTYDPVGNITKIIDRSQQRVFTDNQAVEPQHQYTYDALYRLLEANGREHIGLAVPDYYKPANFKQSAFANLNDSTQLGTYTERYTYDLAGNLNRIQHIASESSRNFTREIAVDSHSNRAVLKENELPVNFDDLFDANGNCAKLENIAKLTWNYRDNIHSAVIIERPSEPSDAEYYTYDSQGQRVRKVKETYLGAGVTEVEEKIYLGGCEIKRIWRNETQILERTSLHVMDDQQRIAIAHNWSQDDLQQEIDTLELNSNKTRYQYSNHLGSASLELNPQGQIVSYEEYFPYGGTSFIAGQSQREVKIKEYRYSGKERDDSTGLYYYGARYYAPWIGRWMSADPARIEGSGLNLYWYASDNPVNRIDPDGQKDDDFKSRFQEYEKDRGFLGGAEYETGAQVLDAAKGTASIAGLGAAVGIATTAATMIPGIKEPFLEKLAGMSKEERAAFLDKTIDMLGEFGSNLGEGLKEQFIEPFVNLKQDIDKIASGEELSKDELFQMGRDATKAVVALATVATLAYGTVKAGTSLTTALQAKKVNSLVNDAAHNAVQYSNLKDCLRQTEKYGKAGVKELADGRIRFYDDLNPARNQGEMAGRIRVREWNPATGAKRTWHETIDKQGRVRQVRPENGPVKTHYKFDKEGKYVGKW